MKAIIRGKPREDSRERIRRASPRSMVDARSTREIARDADKSEGISELTPHDDS